MDNRDFWSQHSAWRRPPPWSAQPPAPTPAPAAVPGEAPPGRDLRRSTPSTSAPASPSSSRVTDFTLLYDAGSNDDAGARRRRTGWSPISRRCGRISSGSTISILSHPHKDHHEMLMPDVLVRLRGRQCLGFRRRQPDLQLPRVCLANDRRRARRRLSSMPTGSGRHAQRPLRGQASCCGKMLPRPRPSTLPSEQSMISHGAGRRSAPVRE